MALGLVDRGSPLRTRETFRGSRFRACDPLRAVTWCNRSHQRVDQATCDGGNFVDRTIENDFVPLCEGFVTPAILRTN